jgi:RimJ/RimL family protein N-acetyltransferase
MESSPTAEGRTDVRLEGNWVVLRPVVPADYEYLFELSMEQSARGRWRYYGHTPSPEQFNRSLWQDVVAQFCVWSKATGQRVGVCSAYRGDMRNGHIWLAAAFADDHDGVALEGAVLFVQYLFDAYPLRKIYCEMPEVVEEDVGSAFRRVAQEEGRLTEHHYWMGRYWDWVYLAITRERWTAYMQRHENLRSHASGGSSERGSRTS